MDKVINLGIPHVAENVFESIDTSGLIKCLEVSKTWFEQAGNVLIKRGKGKIRSKMFEACKTGETRVVNLILERYNNESGLNIKDEEEMTVFLWACQNGHKDVVKLLLDHAEEQTIDLNVRVNEEMTALMLACYVLWSQRCCTITFGSF